MVTKIDSVRLAWSHSQTGFIFFMESTSLEPSKKPYIRTASVHVAVFSKSYAQSFYCLNELHQMLETKKPIITVFYDVEPEHVRRPRNLDGPYAEAFKEHDKRHKPEDVEKWVSALEAVGAIEGFVRADYRSSTIQMQRNH